MTYQLDKEQYQQQQRMPAAKRYANFLTKVAVWEEVWSLRNDDGWVGVSSDGEECLPVWPHPDFAQSWATHDWSDCRAEAIPLDVWMERWLPGMEADGSMIAVFPVDGVDGGTVVDPIELFDAINTELAALADEEEEDNE